MFAVFGGETETYSTFLQLFFNLIITMKLFPRSIFHLLDEGVALTLSLLGDGKGNWMGNIWYSCSFSASAVACKWQITSMSSESWWIYMLDVISNIWVVLLETNRNPAFKAFISSSFSPWLRVELFTSFGEKRPARALYRTSTVLETSCICACVTYSCND